MGETRFERENRKTRKKVDGDKNRAPAALLLDLTWQCVLADCGGVLLLYYVFGLLNTTKSEEVARIPVPTRAMPDSVRARLCIQLELDAITRPLLSYPIVINPF